MSVGSTELMAEVPALPAPEQKLIGQPKVGRSVGSTELTAEVPVLPAQKLNLIGRPKAGR
jgi:hypothetical protein